jgi:uncharacterized protein YdeI (YjbR/CyaY-like superfamily)
LTQTTTPTTTFLFIKIFLKNISRDEECITTFTIVNKSLQMLDTKANIFFSNIKKWPHELNLLRKIVLDCGLTEDFKWRNPCYTFQNNNVVIIHGFKDYCALLLFKGALLSDTNSILIQQTENVQSARQIRFTNVKEIAKMEKVLKAYIFEAIEVEKAGLKVELKKHVEFNITEEFEKQLNKNAALKKAFFALTPGRQRGYYLYFAAPKQSATREARIEKYTQQIINGKGLTDCTCGLSKKMPQCDGSHKQLR